LSALEAMRLIALVRLLMRIVLRALLIETGEVRLKLLTCAMIVEMFSIVPVVSVVAVVGLVVPVVSVVAVVDLVVVVIVVVIEALISSDSVFTGHSDHPLDD